MPAQSMIPSAGALSLNLFVFTISKRFTISSILSGIIFFSFIFFAFISDMKFSFSHLFFCAKEKNPERKVLALLNCDGVEKQDSIHFWHFMDVKFVNVAFFISGHILKSLDAMYFMSLRVSLLSDDFVLR
ncbi:hypothetical protein [Intestinicryptomonas porci]|uniref:Uncharacterized protein n=1 Tax=Intestinicryptomonas porci TaxID=2926320 RepID=A0ABU4WI14_9BACT|nr:hypothetical protein [Opitutales bacterium CLA-KB-P66]